MLDFIKQRAKEDLVDCSEVKKPCDNPNCPKTRVERSYDHKNSEEDFVVCGKHELGTPHLHSDTEISPPEAGNLAGTYCVRIPRYMSGEKSCSGLPGDHHIFVRIVNDPVDLDIDSSNTKGFGCPSRSDQEDDIENDAPGKIIYCNSIDKDGDGIIGDTVVNYYREIPNGYKVPFRGDGNPFWLNYLKSEPQKFSCGLDSNGIIYIVDNKGRLGFFDIPNKNYLPDFYTFQYPIL